MYRDRFEDVVNHALLHDFAASSLKVRRGAFLPDKGWWPKGSLTG